MHTCSILIPSMKRKTFLSLNKQLRRLNAQMVQITSELLDEDPLLIGSISEVLRTCGKPNCRCAKKPYHPYLVLMTSRGGRRKCQVVRKADVDQVTLRVRRYRKFRSLLKDLKALETKRRDLLKSIMQAKNEWYS